jgi:hypothetical protein
MILPLALTQASPFLQGQAGRYHIRPDEHPGVTPGKGSIGRIFLLSKQGISDYRFQIEDLELKVAFVSLSLHLQSAS